VADGARNRNRTPRVHGINAPCLTAHKPPFPNSRIMLLISVILSITSITKFLPEQRVDRDGMIQLRARSSTSTSTSTKNSQNKTMHRSGRSASLNFRNHFGGHSVMVAVIFRKLATSPLVPLCNLALLSNFLARIVPSIQIGVFGAMVIQRAILFDC